MRLFSSLRAPTVQRERDWTSSPPIPTATIQVASGVNADDAFSALVGNSSKFHNGALLVPELASSHRLGTSPFLARAVLNSVGLQSPAVVGIPRPSRDNKRRWQRLAASSAARFIILGESGWVRLNLGDLNFRLASVDVSAEVVDAPVMLGMLRVEREREPFDFWPAIVHPQTAFRASVGVERDRLCVELGCIRQAHWIVDLTPGGGVSGHETTAILAITDDIVAAEISVLAAQQLSWIRAGYEERGPWEHPRIQAACELRLGIVAGYDCVLQVRKDDKPAAKLAERISLRLECHVEFLS